MAIKLRWHQGLVGKSVLYVLTIPFIHHCLDDHREDASIKVKI